MDHNRAERTSLRRHAAPYSPSPGELRTRAFHLPYYLIELAAIAGRTVSEEEVGSLEDAQRMRRCLLHPPRQEHMACNIPFDERLHSRFARFIGRLYEVESSPVYVWTENTYRCGTFQLPSLLDIHAGFAFDATANLYSLSTPDFRNTLFLVPEWVRGRGERLECITRGERWASIRY